MNFNYPELEKFLRPPGEGVYTVQTAKEKKELLKQKMNARIPQTSQSSVNTPYLLGICSDAGGGILRGANWGPLFLRLALLDYFPSCNYRDLGDIPVVPHLLHDDYLSEKTLNSVRKFLYPDVRDQHLPVSPLSIAEKVMDTLLANAKTPEEIPRVISLGGDHSVSYPLVKSYAQKMSTFPQVNLGLLHFDAHTDLLTERMGIPICFGSWTSHIIPYFKNPAQIVQVGIRSSGKDQSHWEKTFGIKQFWAKTILQDSAQGSTQWIEAIKEHFQQMNVTHLYLTFDIDALDASEALFTGTAEVGGPQLHHYQSLLQALEPHFPIVGGDVVEVAPFTCDKSVLEKSNYPMPMAPCADSTLLCGATILSTLLNWKR